MITTHLYSYLDTMAVRLDCTQDPMGWRRAATHYAYLRTCPKPKLQLLRLAFVFVFGGGGSVHGFMSLRAASPARRGRPRTVTPPWRPLVLRPRPRHY